MIYTAGSGGASVATILVDAVTPVGTIDGINPTFLLPSIPTPAASLELWRSGVLQLQNGVDYTLSSNAINFQAASIPSGADNLTAYYRTTSQSVINASFTYDEIPTGVINGINNTFTLAATPDPSASLQLFKNGILMKAGGTDYTLVGGTITYVASQIPQVGDTHICDYRQTTGSFVNPIFVDNETPTGTIDGVNPTFTLVYAPSPAGSLELYRNGIFQYPSGIDFTLAGLTITFVAGAIPQAGDLLIAFYQR